MNASFAIGLFIVVLLSKGGSTKRGETKCPQTANSQSWPANCEETECSQTTKQKALYSTFKFEPSLKDKPMVDMSVKVRWDEIKYAPWNTRKKGATYAAYVIGFRKPTVAPGGYFGVISYDERGGKFLFSMWDKKRDVNAKKPAEALAWGLTPSTCKRNCQDCGRNEIKKQGLTTGTQCKITDKDMRVGDQIELRLTRTKESVTINTKDYGGMPLSHAKINEVDRDITGGVWKVTARNVRTDKTFQVGTMLLENGGKGMTRLTSFDEMVGCNKCNDIYHKDTREGPVIHDGDVTRRPVRVVGKSNAKKSTCKKFGISGDKAKNTITFEAGPGSTQTFTAGENYVIWE